MVQATFLGGLVVGTGLTMLLDPQQGARRRSMFRDKSQHILRDAENAVRVGARDLVNRALGAKQRLLGAFEPLDADDQKVKERVRAELGRICSHASALEVSVEDGQVTLRGPVLASEESTIMHRIGGVRGVDSVVSALDAHVQGDDVPELRGEHRIRHTRMRPATCFVLGTASAAAGFIALARGNLVGAAMGAIGAAAAIARIEHRYDARSESHVPRRTAAPSTAHLN